MLFTLLFYLLITSLLHGQTTSPIIPETIKIILDKEYPNWKFSEVSKDIYDFFEANRIRFHPNFISGDFNGNGERDYAVQITYKKDRIVIAFLQRGKNFERHVLETHFDYHTDIYLWLLRKGEKGYDYETEKEFHYAHDSIGVMFFEKAGGSHVFEKGKFRRIVSSD